MQVEPHLNLIENEDRVWNTLTHPSETWRVLRLLRDSRERGLPSTLDNDQATLNSQGELADLTS